MNDTDIEALERATIEAVSPDQVQHLPGWLLPMDAGTVGRARSAVPLSHPTQPDQQALQANQLADIAARYRAQGMKPAFRIPDTAIHLHTALATLGMQRMEPTLVMKGTLAALAATPVFSRQGRNEAAAPKASSTGARNRSDIHAQPPTLMVETSPGEGWQALFLGEGFDPVDGAHRVRLLSRSPRTLYVSALLDDEVVACGAASFGHGWMGVHGMRTALSHRGQGLAAQVLRVMAHQARVHVHGQGVSRVFLQVGATNTAALALYKRAGFAEAWPYAYWKPAD